MPSRILTVVPPNEGITILVFELSIDVFLVASRRFGAYASVNDL